MTFESMWYQFHVYILPTPSYFVNIFRKKSSRKKSGTKGDRCPLYPQLVHKDLWIMWITALKQQPLPLGEVPRRGGEGSDVSKISNVATLSVTLTGASSPNGGSLSFKFTSSAAIFLLLGAHTSCRRAPCRRPHRSRCCGRSTRYFHSPLPRPRLS